MRAPAMSDAHPLKSNAQSNSLSVGPMPSASAVLKSDLIVVGNPGVSPNPITAGNTLTVGVSIKNQGSGSAPATTTRLQIKNAALTATVADQTYSTPVIAAGQTISQSYSIVIPAGTTAGSYTANVMIDSTYTGNQSNGANDSKQSNSFTVNAPAGTACLTGFVYDQQSNAPLANVTVTLASSTLGTTTHTTSSNGYYSFTGVAKGAYTLSATIAGYGTNSMAVSLAGTLSQPMIY